jgi:hypothetical protein
MDIEVGAEPARGKAGRGAAGPTDHSPETPQPSKTGQLGAPVPGRLSDRLVSVSQTKRPFSSQVGNQRFHFKLDVGRQSPQSSPMEHFESLCVG